MIVPDLCIYFFFFLFCNNSLLDSFASLHECIIFLQPTSLKTTAVTLLCCPTTGANLYFTPSQTQLLFFFSPLFTVRSCPQKSLTMLCHLFIRVPGQMSSHPSIYFTICTCALGAGKYFYFGIFCIIKESKRFNHKNNVTFFFWFNFGKKNIKKWGLIFRYDHV